MSAFLTKASQGNLHHWRWLAAAMMLTVSTIANAAEAPSVDTPVRPYFSGAREEGWFWYQDPAPVETPNKPHAEKVAPGALTTSTPTESAPRSAALKAFDKFKRDVEDAKNTMIAVPTPENVRLYVELQTKLVKRASEVADAFQRVVWANPQFDFTQERPVVNTAMRAYEMQQQQTRRQTFDRLAANSVFYFFFRGDCEYCHAFAPTLLSFAQATGIKVFPISQDGGSLPQFPTPRLDNGISARLGVNMVPALFLATPATGEIVPVGFGALSDSELAERLIALANPGATQAVTAATPISRLPELPFIQ
jgi:conjugal transfer pilus assembly protein TraF